MTTVNDITDILRIIREQPEWADALRAALLSQELLEMPQKLTALTAAFTEFMETANKRFAALESDVADLKAGQARLESAVSQLQGDVGNMRGTDYEIKLGKNIDSTLGQRLGLRGTRLIKGSLAGNNAVYLDLVDSAEDRGDITEQEHEEINETDFVLRGRSRIDQSTVYVVVEASVAAGDSDINRAAARAAILEKATGNVALPAVVCDNFDDARQRLAQERNVTLITIRE